MDITFFNKKSNEEVKLTFETAKVSVFKVRFKVGAALKLRPDSFFLETKEGFIFRDDTQLDVTEESFVFVVPTFKVVRVKVAIETDGFENAVIETFKACSVKMIKYFLTLKTSIQAGNMIIASSTQIESDSTTLEEIETIHSQRELFSTSISDISSDYNELSDKKGVRLNLLIKKNKKFVLGLDFAFNQINNMNQSEFDPTAPSYREGTDGLNILAECTKKDCTIKGESFLSPQGKGKIEVKRRSEQIVCPKCSNLIGNSVKFVFINCEWAYSAYLTNKAVTRGEGRTYGASFFFTGLIDLSKFEKLIVQVKQKQEEILSEEQETKRSNECSVF